MESQEGFDINEKTKKAAEFYNKRNQELVAPKNEYEIAEKPNEWTIVDEDLLRSKYGTTSAVIDERPNHYNEEEAKHVIVQRLKGLGGSLKILKDMFTEDNRDYLVTYSDTSIDTYVNELQKAHELLRQDTYGDTSYSFFDRLIEILTTFQTKLEDYTSIGGVVKQVTNWIIGGDDSHTDVIEMMKGHIEEAVDCFSQVEEQLFIHVCYRKEELDKFANMESKTFFRRHIKENNNNPTVNQWFYDLSNEEDLGGDARFASYTFDSGEVVMRSLLKECIRRYLYLKFNFCRITSFQKALHQMSCWLPPAKKKDLREEFLKIMNRVDMFHFIAQNRANLQQITEDEQEEEEDTEMVGSMLGKKRSMSSSNVRSQTERVIDILRREHSIGEDTKSKQTVWKHLPLTYSGLLNRKNTHMFTPTRNHEKPDPFDRGLPVRSYKDYQKEIQSSEIVPYLQFMANKGVY